MRIPPRRAALLMSAGRAALGAAVLASPANVTARWLGERNARLPVVRDLAISLGARDVALGIAGIYARDDRRLGPRVLAACAAVDAADVVGTLVARRHLPAAGVAGTVAVAGGAALYGAALARELARAG
ncbi:MAG TPA: hypothetical protein VFW29_03680 [Solirubrobacteraceae bacterium]|nr:hypothetical protein [Solirubrobacteraceae bacterium]